MEPRSLRAGKLHCLVWGGEADPPVLLIHGAGMLSRWWEALVPLLPGHRLIAPDLRGHGESEWADAYMIDDFAADLVESLDGVEPRPAAVVGHSMGGRVVVWLAAHHPGRVARVALLDTRMAGLSQERVDRWRGAGETAARSGRAQRVYATRAEAEASFRVTPNEAIEPARRDRLARYAVVERSAGEWSLRFDRRVLALEGSRVADLSHLLARVGCPALVVRGAASTVIGAAGCEAMAAAMPNAHTAVIPGGHHFALSHPRETAQLLREFFSA